MNDEFLEELTRVLDYNPKTGAMTWKIAVGTVKAGSPAGCVHKDGRLHIGFKRKIYLAHRLAWLLTYGKWPEQMIDHIDGNPLNNRLANLRDVSNAVNSQNQRKAMSGKSEPLGVNWDKLSRKFRAMIQINGKKKHLGYFLTEEAAYAAYLVAKREFHEGNML